MIKTHCILLATFAMFWEMLCVCLERL